VAYEYLLALLVSILARLDLARDRKQVAGFFIGEVMTERIRGRKLQRIREQHFRLHPLCVKCQEKGRVRAATQLDHKVALVNGGKDFDEDEGRNRQGLCDDCHDEKTRQDLGHRARVTIGADGWPVEGDVR